MNVAGVPQNQLHAQHGCRWVEHCQRLCKHELIDCIPVCGYVSKYGRLLRGSTLKSPANRRHDLNQEGYGPADPADRGFSRLPTDPDKRGIRRVRIIRTRRPCKQGIQQARGNPRRRRPCEQGIERILSCNPFGAEVEVPRASAAMQKQ